jgi:DNA-binding beta-propeller fold protein YncE
LPTAPEATPRRRLAAWLAATALAASGCGSLAPEDLPPAATPAASPPAAAAAAGRVVHAGAAPAAGRLLARTATRLASGPRTFEVLERENAVRVLAGRRELARAPTGLQPAALALLDSGRQVGVLSVRGRVLELFDARTLARTGRADAGTGPANVVSDGGNYLYVTDTTGGAVLIFRVAGGLRLERRYPLAGSPYAIAYDGLRRRLWVTLTATNELVELSAGRRPRELRRFPSVRGPVDVAVAPASGRVVVSGAGGDLVQLLDPPPLPAGG